MVEFPGRPGVPSVVERRTFSLAATVIKDEVWVLMPLTTRKGASSAFAGQRWSCLSAFTTSLIARAWFASRTRALMGTAQRGSNRSNAMMVKKRKIDSEKRDADRPICQGHQDPIESKGPPPDRRQMHALNGWFELRLRDGVF